MILTITLKGMNDMKIRRIALICAIVILCISGALYGTIAYITAIDTATNVITTGDIKLKLIESAKAEDGSFVPFEDVSGVMPGTSASKIVEVKNTGSKPAFVRVKVTKSAEIKPENSEEVDLSLITMDIDEENWTLKDDGFYYYNSPLEAGETTAPLFKNVFFSKDMDNVFKNATIKIGVTAYGVQTANNGTSSLDAQGWPLEGGAD